MPENHDNQNMAEIRIWIKAQGKKNRVCMYGLNHGNPGLRLLTSLFGYGLSNRGVGGHTC